MGRYRKGGKTEVIFFWAFLVLTTLPDMHAVPLGVPENLHDDRTSKTVSR